MTELEEALRRLRDICIDLPEVTETLTFHHPTWQANRKTFCVLDRYQGDDCVCFKTSLEKQHDLVATGRFFAAPYGGKQGWTCAALGDDLDWDEIEELVIASWRLFANRRMLAAFEGADK
jgi:predicted DNA-binding protein (MmcQ/YjbR family)